MSESDPTARTVRLVKAAGIREASDLFLRDEWRLFDNDEDSALVAQRLIEIAEDYEARA